MPQTITLATSDGLEIVGDYYAQDGEKFAILLHMMPATKESWQDFAIELHKNGYSSIAIDLRGHGDSTLGGEIDYTQFEDQEHAASIADVYAAKAFLLAQGAKEENIVIIGASIGANLALQFLAENPAMKKAIALSPGLDYRSVTTNDKVMAYGDDQFAMVVASQEDEYSYISIQKLAELSGQVESREEEGIGHGTDMFKGKPELMNELISWL